MYSQHEILEQLLNGSLVIYLWDVKRPGRYDVTYSDHSDGVQSVTITDQDLDLFDKRLKIVVSQLHRDFKIVPPLFVQMSHTTHWPRFNKLLDYDADDTINYWEHLTHNKKCYISSFDHDADAGLGNKRAIKLTVYTTALTACGIEYIDGLTSTEMLKPPEWFDQYIGSGSILTTLETLGLSDEERTAQLQKLYETAAMSSREQYQIPTNIEFD